MSAFTNQKKEILKYYKKTNEAVDSHRETFGELLKRLNEHNSLIHSIANNYDDFISSCFPGFQDFRDKVNKNPLNDSKIQYVFDMNKKLFLKKCQLPNKKIIQTQNFVLTLCKHTKYKAQNNSTISQTVPWNYVQSLVDCNLSLLHENSLRKICNCYNYSCGCYSQNSMFESMKSCKLFSLSQTKSLTIIVDNYFNLFVPSLKTYLIYNYSFFPLHTFYTNMDKLNVYHNVIEEDKRTIHYNFHNESDNKEFTNICSFVDSINDYSTSIDDRNKYKDTLFQYLFDFYKHDEKQSFFEQYQSLSDKFSNVNPLSDPLEDDSTDALESEQKIYWQSQRIRELEITSTKQLEELEYLRKERINLIQSCGDKDSNIQSRDELISQINNNLRNQITESAKYQRDIVELKRRLLSIDELETKLNRTSKEFRRVTDEMEDAKIIIKEHEIVNQNLMDSQIESTNKIKLMNKDKKKLLSRIQELCLDMEKLQVSIRELNKNSKIKTAKNKKLQKHLDNVIENLDSVKNGTMENSEYQQILMRQLKNKTQQLEKSKKQVILLEKNNKKIIKNHKLYKNKLSIFVQQYPMDQI